MIPLEKIKTGDKVRYVPNHANGNMEHDDCEDGIVKSKNDTYVFVQYYTKPRYSNGNFIDGFLQLNAKATNPNDLIYTQ